MIMMQGNELYKCPAGKDGKPLRRVLDVGTGTGIWALEVGKYPRPYYLHIVTRELQMKEGLLTGIVDLAEEHPETSVRHFDQAFRDDTHYWRSTNADVSYPGSWD